MVHTISLIIVATLAIIQTSSSQSLGYKIEDGSNLTMICSEDGCISSQTVSEMREHLSSGINIWTKPELDDREFSDGNTIVLHKLNYMNPEQLEETEIFFYQNNSRDLPANSSVSQFSNLMTSVKLIIQMPLDYFIHRYDDQADIKLAAGPQVNQELCLNQLEHLIERAKVNRELGPKSRDLNFVQYLDTFGGSPTGALIGNWLRVGSYEACIRIQILVPGDEKYSAARYCIGSLRYKDWPVHDPIDEILTLKTGICLPESCDSVDYKNKFQLIKQLNDYHARQADDSDSMELTSVYCLPDDKSEMRMWWRSRPTFITIILTCSWILILVAATMIDERNKWKQFGKQNISKRTDNLARLCGSLSIINNLRNLIITENPRKADNQAQIQPLGPERKQSESLTETSTLEARSINFNVLKGIKTLAAIYIITGHVLMSVGIVISNHRENATFNLLAFMISNMISSFVVNAFFSITGVLTSYSIFRWNKSIILSPIKWTGFILIRYLKMVPIYAIVILFCKHVVRYIGDGPFWDYGTSTLAARRNCEQESWAWTFLLAANFKSPMNHCIPTAWYLANDFQFIISAPIFLVALLFKPRLGKSLLVFSILAGYLSGIWKIFSTDAADLRPVAEFMPHAFMVYISHLHESYTQPQYRIPSYLVGLLMGYMLFEFDQRRGAHLGQLNSRQVGDGKPAPSWPRWMVRFGPLFTLSILLATILTPHLAHFLGPMPRNRAKLIVSLFQPTFHLLNSIAIGNHVLLAATGYGYQFLNRFLSHNFWKPFARLGLCVMLVNVEVITYLVQTSRASQNLDNYYLCSLFLMASIYSFLVAAILHLLFELPIRAVTNHFIRKIS